MPEYNAIARAAQWMFVVSTSAGMLMNCAVSAHAQTQVQVQAREQQEQEQRRAQERARMTREQNETTRDARLPSASPVAQERLPEETPCFPIHALVLGGDRAEAFQWLLAHAAGADGSDPPTRCLGAQGVDLVARRLQQALLAKGFVTSRLLVEPQNLVEGTLRLTLVPGLLRELRLKDAAVARAGWRHAVPLRSGDVLNLRDLEQALENFSRSPTVHASFEIEPTDSPGQSDVVVTWQQDFPLRLSAGLDDSGSRATSKYLGYATLAYDNPLGLGDTAYLSVNHALAAREGSVKGYTLHYSVPLGYWLVGLTHSHHGNWRTVRGATENYRYSGKGDNSELEVARVLRRSATARTTAQLKAFRSTSKSFIDDTEVQVQSRQTGGWELGMEHRQFMGAATADLGLSYRRGTGAFGALPAPEELFGEGTSRYRIWKADTRVVVPFAMGAQQLRYTGQWRAQWNQTRLTPQERLSIGGRHSVRGFGSDAALTGDRGWTLRNEIGWQFTAGHELFAGLDAGRVGGTSADTLDGRNLRGAVLGVRGGVGRMSYEVFAGRPLHKPASLSSAGTTAGFTLNWQF
jgi:hemolysin activation/secretion protein